MGDCINVLDSEVALDEAKVANDVIGDPLELVRPETVFVLVP